MFKLNSKFQPTGDQPQAIAKLTRGLENGLNHQVLLGITGSGKTYSIACVIANVQKPTLVISPNKTLAAQLYQEFKEFFPHNSVHYFVSYYDYYQPEAYIPHTNTYIEKDARINEEIDRLRHAATQAILNRDDVIIVASVSCIYNLGSPKDYRRLSLNIFEGQKINIKEFVARLIRLQYSQDIELKRGTFRQTAGEIEIVSPSGDTIVKIKLPAYPAIALKERREAGSKTSSQTKIQKIFIAENVDLDSLIYKEPCYQRILEFKIFPARYWVAAENKVDLALANIKAEFQKHIQKLSKTGQRLEAERLKSRTEEDIRMIKKFGYCPGIENYSRHFDFRNPGDPPFTMLDFFKTKGNFLTVIDESHLTIPQIRGMYYGDHSRKLTLVEHGFRLPSALDNRPLYFEEFNKKIGQRIYTSATPSGYELKKSGNKGLVEQLIRPTGLTDPTIEIRSSKNQIEHLIREIKKRVIKNQRVLVTTLTKRMAEDLSEFLAAAGIKVNYIHSEIKTLDRLEIIHDLRLGNYDVIVGVNLLREGLDLPEVSLVAILDADKEGFLRNTTTLIQTMGRAARHLNGHIIMYGDRVTHSMAKAIKETQRRRKIQEEYNRRHGITPETIRKEIKKISLPSSKDRPRISRWYSYDFDSKENLEKMPLGKRIERLTKEMQQAVRKLQFERALVLRQEVQRLKNLSKTEIFNP